MRILNRQPLPHRVGEELVGSEVVKIRASQIIAWVGLTDPRSAGATPEFKFPAILDTGHSHNFSIHARHLTAWAGLRVTRLEPQGTLRERGQLLPMRKAVLWLYPNHLGTKEPRNPPLRLRLPGGIAVYPPESGFPRLPLIGLRTLQENQLRLWVDCQRMRVDLWTARRWWLF
jgi:hypothetical protein